MTPVEKFTLAASLIIFFSISFIIEEKIAVRVTNPTESPYSIKKNTPNADFSVVIPEQSKLIKPDHMAFLSMIPESDPKLNTSLSKLLRTNKTEQQNKTFWFPTPKASGNTEDHSPIQTRILKELHDLNEKEKLTPKNKVESRKKFLERRVWADTLLTESAKQAVDIILVEYQDFFARMDVGMNKEFKVKITPKYDRVVYSQGLPMPIHLKEDLFVEVDVMHRNGIIRVLPFSKYATPFFAQRKLNRNLRLLVDLRKSSTLIADDYTNHPVSTLSDAAQHLAGKFIFCKVAFNSASKTFAYKRLAQGLSKSACTFSSLVSENLDPVVKADQCAQNVAFIGFAANTATDLTRNIRAAFQCMKD